MITKLLEIPFILIAFLTTGNFWISMGFLAAKYLIGECWIAPNLTMTQNAADEGQKGQIIGGAFFFMTMAGTVSTALCGFLANYF